MDAPKRIFLELNNTPPCNFGALWYDAEVHQPAGENCAAYVLESEVEAANKRGDGLSEMVEMYKTMLKSKDIVIANQEKRINELVERLLK